jgi:murein DD-endopeptidase MepM/ murein hydrolase activator NlpD
MTMLKIPMQTTHFGYKFGEINADKQIHPGWDLNFGKSPNADLGMPVYPLTDGEVVYARNAGAGWGNIMIIYYKSISRWSRYGHLKEFYFKEGEKVTSQDIVATCGKSGTGAAHCHYDLIKKKLPSWDKYTTGMTMDQVLEWYEDGLRFIDDYNSRSPDVSGDPLVKIMMQSNSNNWGFINELQGMGKITPEQGVTGKSLLNECNDVFRGM